MIRRDLSPSPLSIMVINAIGTITSSELQKNLFDPSSTKNYDYLKSLTYKKSTYTILGDREIVTTLTGYIKNKQTN